MGNVIVSDWTQSEGRNPLVLFENNAARGGGISPTNADVLLTESTNDAYVFDPPQNVSIDLQSNRFNNVVSLIGMKGVTEVRLFTSTDDITYTLFAVVNVSDSDCTTIIFNRRPERYFRVRFHDGSSGASLRGLWIGRAFEFPGGVGYNYTPVWMAQEKELLVSKTLNGQFVGNRVVSKGAMTTIPMIAEERTFVEEDLQPFIQHYNDGRPFIWAAGPTVFTKDTAYVWRQQNAEMKPTFDQSGNWMSFSMAVEGYVT